MYFLFPILNIGFANKFPNNIIKTEKYLNIESGTSTRAPYSSLEILNTPSIVTNNTSAITTYVIFTLLVYTNFFFATTLLLIFVTATNRLIAINRYKKLGINTEHTLTQKMIAS